MEDLIGSCLYDLLPEDLARERRANIDKVFRTGSPLRFEDEREGRAYETFVYPIFDSDGRVKMVSILGVDITEHRQMEESIRRSEERFRELFNYAPVGYHEYDREGRITEVNQTELEMLGYSREEMLGRRVWEFVVEEISEKMVRGKASGIIPVEGSFERKYKRKDGTILHVLITDRALKDSEGRIIGIRTALQDISRLKEVEKEKESLQEQLRQSQKMEAIGRLAGGVAHDFNNLLTVIKGYAQLSLLGLKEDSPLRDALKEIGGAADRASQLTRQLLAFSRRQIFEMKVLNINSIIKDLEKMVRRIIGEDIELVSILADDLGKVKTDPGQIEQVILNLVVNARDAMPEGGRLTIETKNVFLDEEYAKSHVAVTVGPYVMLSVSDTGCGMTPEVKEKIFEPFFTTKEKGKGTGLGLSTVYGIVKQSGGNIWVYSEPGQGSTFKIYLPRVEEEGEFQRVPIEKEIPKGSETILVIEDDDSVRRVAVRFLKRQGYVVFEAKRGEEALEIFKNHNGPIHLILVDVIMPGESGPQLIERIKENSWEFKVLYMSGYTDNAIVHHGVLKKGVEFIQKPFTLESLSRKVREVLDK
jgi:PAS domain S-box-containing protein